MSAFKYATVWCDKSADDPLMACGEYVEGDTAALARKEAKRLGWKVAQPQPGANDIPRDYCPMHSPEPTDSGS